MYSFYAWCAAVHVINTMFILYLEIYPQTYFDTKYQDLSRKLCSIYVLYMGLKF